MEVAEAFVVDDVAVDDDLVVAITPLRAELLQHNFYLHKWSGPASIR